MQDTTVGAGSQPYSANCLSVATAWSTLLTEKERRRRGQTAACSRPVRPGRHSATLGVMGRSDVRAVPAIRKDPAHPQWEDEDRLWAGIAETERFFMGESKVQRATDKVVRLLEEDGIPYALIGAMALNAYGYVRATVDVDLLLTREGLDAFKQKHLGLGYVQKFPGSKGLRDTEHGVTIDH